MSEIFKLYKDKDGDIRIYRGKKTMLANFRAYIKHDNVAWKIFVWRKVRDGVAESDWVPCMTLDPYTPVATVANAALNLCRLGMDDGLDDTNAYETLSFGPLTHCEV